MKEKLNHSRALAAVGALVLMASLLVGSPAAAEPPDEGELVVSTRDPVARTVEASFLDRPQFTFVPCLQFTDSIVRLYSAYFLRAPDAEGFDFWQTNFESGQWSLPRMSAHFSQSAEFVRLYGPLTDAEFINLIYLNVLGRPADDEGRDYWLGRMANEGLDRGTVMLFFSESPEYVTLTQSAPSPAGDFNWYPEGTQFACGFNDAEYEIKPGLPFLDVVLVNFGSEPITVTYEVRQSGTWVVIQESTLQSGGNLQAFGWALANNTTLTGLRFSATGDFNWSVAQSPTVTPETRVGWS